MSKFEKLIAQILIGKSDANIAYKELGQLLIHLGFDLRRGQKEAIAYSENLVLMRKSTSRKTKTMRSRIKSNKSESSSSNTNWGVGNNG
jgi:hypothetical protein